VPLAGTGDLHVPASFAASFAYDIEDDRTRRRVAKTLKGYGRRVQRSVFECNLTRQQIRELAGHLKQICRLGDEGSPSGESPPEAGANPTAPGSVSIRCYRLCDPCAGRIDVLGAGKVTRDDPFYMA